MNPTRHDETLKKDPTDLKKRRRRSIEGAERKRKKYQEILRRRKQYQASVSTAKTDKPICKYYYRNGYCVHGDNCNYSHVCVPLTTKEQKLCKFFLKGDGSCKYAASECKYSHDSRLFLCRMNVIDGVCLNQDTCAFKHMDPGSISSLDEAEKLRFCYNNKGFLTRLLASKLTSLGNKLPLAEGSDSQSIGLLVSSIDPSQLDGLPWYLRYVHILLIRDNERSESDQG